MDTAKGKYKFPNMWPTLQLVSDEKSGQVGREIKMILDHIIFNFIIIYQPYRIGPVVLHFIFTFIMSSLLSYSLTPGDTQAIKLHLPSLLSLFIPAGSGL